VSFQKKPISDLREYQVKRMKVLMEATPRTEVEWRELAELTLSCVLVFNARRGSEAAHLLMEHYATASADVDPVLHSSLSSVEKQLLNRLKVVNVVGKRVRPVPLLLTADMDAATKDLIETRTVCGVHPVNQFVFALPHSQKGHLSFYNTLRRVAHNAGLKKPHLLTTTRVRKHLATMAQV